jgi:DNA polymerase (family 10)
MQLNGDNAFRVRALANGARMIEELEEVDVVELSRQETLTAVEGVGKGIAELVGEFIDRGTTGTYEDLKQVVPEGLLDLLRLPGLGHKKVMAIHEALQLTSVDELEAACTSGRLDALPGFGGKTSQRLLESIARYRTRVEG